MKTLFKIAYWSLLKPIKYNTYMDCLSVGMTTQGAVKFTEEYYKK